MNTLQYLRRYAYYYLYAIALTLAINLLVSGGVSQVSTRLEISSRPVLVIDAGHGGIDGGTTSCTGILEKDLNLEIAKRLDAVFRLFGYETRLTRTNGDSLATEGDTIRAQKISDLKNRVNTVNALENGVLISIHQNFYPQSQYYGPQVFYNDSAKALAAVVQEKLNTLTPEIQRGAKKVTGIYMMEHIETPGILVECGFLSNPGEEARLRQAEYQKKLSAVIACAGAEYLESGLIS